MAKLLSIDGGSLLAFVNLLHRFGVTAEIAEECLKDWDTAKWRIRAFMNPECPRGVVDPGRQPRIPDGTSCIVEHQHRPKVEIDHTNMGLLIRDKQRAGQTISPTEFREGLGRYILMNASVMEFLLQHISLIPDSWKGKRVFFMGTTYCGSRWVDVVRYISWSPKRFQEGESIPDERWEEYVYEFDDHGCLLPDDVIAIFV